MALVEQWKEELPTLKRIMEDVIIMRIASCDSVHREVLAIRGLQMTIIPAGI